MAQREQVPALLVLNRVPARASLTAAMREELSRYDVGLAATGIGNRVALAAAFCEGWGITECAEDFGRRGGDRGARGGAGRAVARLGPHARAAATPSGAAGGFGIFAEKPELGSDGLADAIRRPDGTS